MPNEKPKLEVLQTEDLPSERIVKSAAQSFDVVDGDGHTITLKKPTPLANLDFAKAAGAGGGGEINQLYLAEIFHLKFVSAIDGEIVPTPRSEGELRALYARLGDAGNEAAQKGAIDHFSPSTDNEATIKNS